METVTIPKKEYERLKAAEECTSRMVASHSDIGEKKMQHLRKRIREFEQAAAAGKLFTRDDVGI